MVTYSLPFLFRMGRRAMALPDRAVQRLAGDPVEIDGRVLHRSVQLLVAGVARSETTPDDIPVDVQRRQMRRIGRLGMPVATDLHVSERVVEGPAGRIRLRVYRPFGLGPRPPAVVYFHGGGWILGDLDSHDRSCRVLAAASRCVVISVDYRLAPEHPFPAPLEDCVAAYEWVATNGDELAIDPNAVGVMGDSAGGSLAAVVARVGRDLECPAPVAQGLIYPSTDLSMTTRSMDVLGDGFFLTREAMHWMCDRYIPDRDARRNPLASPLRAEDLAGSAPAWVWTAGFDPLRDEGRLYAEKLDKAGVPTNHRCYDDQVHGFFGMGVMPGGLGIIEEVCSQMGDLVRESAAAR